MDGLEDVIYTYLYEEGKPAIKKSEYYNVKKSEAKTVQYRYLDAAGKEWKRDYDGNYVEGAGEIMDLHVKGWFNTIYTGNKNPERKDENGNPIKDSRGNPVKDYRRIPLSNLDNAAYKHDKSYDELAEKLGVSDFKRDKAALSADKQYVKDLIKIASHGSGEYGKNTVKERLQAGIMAMGTSLFFMQPKRSSNVDSRKKKEE